MKKYLYLFAACGIFVGQAQAALTPAESKAVVRSILNGDLSILENIQTDDGRNISVVSVAATSPNTPVFSCSCHSLDPIHEVACKWLPIAQCGRVGNIICIPSCGMR